MVALDPDQLQVGFAVALVLEGDLGRAGLGALGHGDAGLLALAGHGEAQLLGAVVAAAGRDQHGDQRRQRRAGRGSSQRRGVERSKHA